MLSVLCIVVAELKPDACDGVVPSKVNARLPTFQGPGSPLRRRAMAYHTKCWVGVVLVPKLPKLCSQRSLSQGQIKNSNERTFDCARNGAEPTGGAAALF